MRRQDAPRLACCVCTPQPRSFHQRPSQGQRFDLRSGNAVAGSDVRSRPDRDRRDRPAAGTVDAWGLTQRTAATTTATFKLVDVRTAATRAGRLAAPNRSELPPTPRLPRPPADIAAVWGTSPRVPVGPFAAACTTQDTFSTAVTRLAGWARGGTPPAPAAAKASADWRAGVSAFTAALVSAEAVSVSSARSLAARVLAESSGEGRWGLALRVLDGALQRFATASQAVPPTPQTTATMTAASAEPAGVRRFAELSKPFPAATGALQAGAERPSPLAYPPSPMLSPLRPSIIIDLPFLTRKAIPTHSAEPHPRDLQANTPAQAQAPAASFLFLPGEAATPLEAAWKRRLKGTGGGHPQAPAPREATDAAVSILAASGRWVEAVARFQEAQCVGTAAVEALVDAVVLAGSVEPSPWRQLVAFTRTSPQALRREDVTLHLQPHTAPVARERVRVALQVWGVSARHRGPSTLRLLTALAEGCLLGLADVAAAQRFLDPLVLEGAGVSPPVPTAGWADDVSALRYVVLGGLCRLLATPPQTAARRSAAEDVVTIWADYGLCSPLEGSPPSRPPRLPVAEAPMPLETAQSIVAALDRGSWQAAFAAIPQVFPPRPSESPLERANRLLAKALSGAELPWAAALHLATYAAGVGILSPTPAALSPRHDAIARRSAAKLVTTLLRGSRPRWAQAVAVADLSRAQMDGVMAAEVLYALTLGEPQRSPDASISARCAMLRTVARLKSLSAPAQSCDGGLVVRDARAVGGAEVTQRLFCALSRASLVEHQQPRDYILASSVPSAGDMLRLAALSPHGEAGAALTATAGRPSEMAGALHRTLRSMRWDDGGWVAGLAALDLFKGRMEPSADVVILASKLQHVPAEARSLCDRLLQSHT